MPKIPKSVIPSLMRQATMGMGDIPWEMRATIFYRKIRRMHNRIYPNLLLLRRSRMQWLMTPALRKATRRYMTLDRKWGVSVPLAISSAIPRDSL